MKLWGYSRTTQTVRPLEKPNNYRVYDLDDIETLKKIKQYSIEDNIGISAIKNILLPGIENRRPLKSEINAKYSKELLSNKWKESREKLNYTLEDVSSKIGISPSYLSKIEKGQANISLDILYKLADFYGESILYFFNKNATDSKVVRKGTGEKIDVGLEGVIMESLVAVKDNVLYPLIFNVEPGCGSQETHRHHGEEFLFILDGRVEVLINNKDVYVLKTGDSMYFKSNEYHSWKNISKKISRILWVHCPYES